MKGYLAAAAAFSVWGIASSLLVRIIPLPGPYISGVGCLVGALLLLAILGPSRLREARAAYRSERRRIWLMASAFAGCSLTFHLAVKTTLVANAVLTHTTYPLMTCLVFLPLMRGKRPGAIGLAALALGAAGIVTLFWPQLSWRSSWLGEILGLASAAFFAWYNALMDGWKSELPREAALAPMLIVAAAFMFPFSAAAYPHVPSPTAAVGLLAFGAACFTVPNILYFYAARRIPVSHIVTLGYLEPVVAISGAALALGEGVSGFAVVGGALVLASGAIIVFSGKKSPVS